MAVRARGMLGAMALVLVGVLVLAGCGGDTDNASDTNAAPTSAPRGGEIVIRTKMVVAATAGSEPIATGEVLAGSTLAGSPFCAKGTILDSHASSDPTMKPYGLVARTITCPDGTVRMGITPKPPNGGPWTIVLGTGDSRGCAGAGRWRSSTTPPTTHWLARR